jgi:hypothetical protein
MGEYLDQIPEEIRGHIKEITRTSGLPAGEESEELIAMGWLEKKKAFEEKIAEMEMEEVEFFDKVDERATLALTYSGSLWSTISEKHSTPVLGFEVMFRKRRKRKIRRLRRT